MILRTMFISMMVLGIVGTGVITASEGGSITASGSMDYYSKYMWRGYTLDVDPVLQPGFSLTGYGITASVWGSMPVANRDGVLSNEVDLTIGYSFQGDGFTISLGHISYQFPVITPTMTNEVYIGMGLTKLPVGVALTYYNDYSDSDGIKGSYIGMDISKELALTPYPVTTALHYGVFNEYGVIASGSDLSVSVKTTLPATSALGISPLIGYVVPGGDLSDSTIGAQGNALYGGISIGYSF